MINLLDIRGLSMTFPAGHGLLASQRTRLRAIEDVDLTIRRGETLGLVGESGCGKTTLGRCVLRGYRPDAGVINYTKADGTVVDLAKLSRRELKPFRAEIRTVFQDPHSSLNPRMTVGRIIAEPLRTTGIAAPSEIEDRVARMLRLVGLRPEYMRRYPHAFSGGQRQRIGIARALITEPRLVVADEAVSALDVSVRSQILNLLEDLQEKFDLTYLFISHDLSVVQHLCDRVAVLYVGKVVEQAPTDELYDRPRHPYTESLLRSLPRPDPRARRNRARRLQGELPDPANPPSGCAFHPRCPYAEAQCQSQQPALGPATEQHLDHVARCHFSQSLQLNGI